MIKRVVRNYCLQTRAEFKETEYGYSLKACEIIKRDSKKMHFFALVLHSWMNVILVM